MWARTNDEDRSSGVDRRDGVLVEIGLLALIAAHC